MNEVPVESEPCSCVKLCDNTLLNDSHQTIHTEAFLEDCGVQFQKRIVWLFLFSKTRYRITYELGFFFFFFQFLLWGEAYFIVQYDV